MLINKYPAISRLVQVQPTYWWQSQFTTADGTQLIFPTILSWLLPDGIGALVIIFVDCRKPTENHDARWTAL